MKCQFEAVFLGLFRVVILNIGHGAGAAASRFVALAKLLLLIVTGVFV